MFVRSSSLLSLPLERVSATSLRSPLNHWLYDLSLSNMKRLAFFLAALIWTNDWSLLSPSLLKLDFWNWPSAIVLSVINRTQSCGFKCPSIMLIHGEIIAARCSNKLFDALNFKGSGMYQRQAKPLALYPLSPALQESKRWTCVGRQKAMLFRLIPLCAVFDNSSISLRSFAYSPLIFTARRNFAVLCRSQRWLMKWWTNRIAIPRWTSLPIFVSSSFTAVIPSESIDLIAIVHALYLFSGRIISSCLKSINQPRIFFLSLGGAFDANLLCVSITSQGISLCWCSGRAQVSIASNGAWSHRTKLSIPLSSTVREIRLLM